MRISGAIGHQRRPLRIAGRMLVVALYLSCSSIPCLVWGAPAWSGEAQSAFNPLQTVPGELLVKFRSGVSEARVQWILAQIDGHPVDVVATIRLYRIRLADPHRLAEAIKVLQGFPEVEYAEPNVLESQPSAQ